MVACPCCKELYSISDLKVGAPSLRSGRRWFEPSHRNGKIICPRCGCILKLRKSSLWPLSLVFLPIVIWPLLSMPYSVWLLISFSLLAILLARRYIRFDVDEGKA